MGPIIKYKQFELDLGQLYERMWAIGTDDHRDGTRLYRPQPGARQALKWLIAELAGTPVDPVRTMPANDHLRRQAHGQLVDLGWADRLSQSSFRLLINPGTRQPQEQTEDVALIEDPDDAGAPVDDIDAASVVDTADRLVLAGLDWSEWSLLNEAAKSATQHPGVYVARTGGQLVYVGMAGERRGQGVRGRLTVYARGRGAVSGLGEAALDRALADETWIEGRLADLRADGPSRSKFWAAKALKRIPIEIAWTAATSADQAREWERAALEELADVDLWNRLRPK